ncbi:MAG TPA: c-type cytochrome [Longimicrobiales bacterium]|nr:c-type cytochrome [Longimicrobiales bacterium]
MRAHGIFSQTVVTHRVDFPVPYPLAPEELAALEAGQDPEAVALERAIERGRHLVGSRYVCGDCHGESYGGGVMVDDPMVGTALGPNLTRGRGTRVSGYTPADWDRAVRHGVLPDGTPSVMPSGDFLLMSDQELSDVIAYIGSLPPVDNEVPAKRLGPLGNMLVATGQLPVAAMLMDSHDEPHAELPPATEVSLEFGRHMAGVCTGCHGPDFSGGPIVGGDPSWAPARNITLHPEGLAGWTYEDFETALREGKRPDGTALAEPMTFVTPYAANMTDVEMRALWTYLQSVPALPTGG